MQPDFVTTFLYVSKNKTELRQGVAQSVRELNEKLLPNILRQWFESVRLHFCNVTPIFSRKTFLILQKIYIVTYFIQQLTNIKTISQFQFLLSHEIFICYSDFSLVAKNKNSLILFFKTYMSTKLN